MLTVRYIYKQNRRITNLKGFFLLGLKVGFVFLKIEKDQSFHFPIRILETDRILLLRLAPFLQGIASFEPASFHRLSQVLIIFLSRSSRHTYGIQKTRLPTKSVPHYNTVTLLCCCDIERVKLIKIGVAGEGGEEQGW